MAPSPAALSAGSAPSPAALSAGSAPSPAVSAVSAVSAATAAPATAAPSASAASPSSHYLNRMWRTANQIPAAPTTHRERLTMLFGSGIWLIFLVFPFAGVLLTPSLTPLERGLGYAGICGFGLTYILIFQFPDMRPSWPRWVSLTLWSIPLLACAALIRPFPFGFAYTAPFVAAVWIFSLPLIPGIPCGLVCFAGGAAAHIWAPYDFVWAAFLGSIIIPMIPILISRLLEEFATRSARMRAELILSEQRSELASVVHDVLGHSLTAITVKTQLAARLLESNPEAARAELEDSLKISRNAIDTVRATVTDLRQPTLDVELDSAYALLRSARITAHFTPPPELPLLTAQLFAWVVREAVTNTVRHSGARNCTITIEQRETGARLRVEDDGVGIPTGAPAGTGLTGLRERVEAAGGTLAISRLEPGTRVEVVL
ncbi:sensor histidine kinase [Actinotignum sp. GS-2025b]|nr:histidine kinase [Actinotignum timonense]